MLLSAQPFSPQSAPSCPPILQTYHLVEQQLSVHEYFSLLSKQESPKLQKQSQTTPKMMSKLLNWLQKLAIETFHFHRQTLIVASSIINQYLQKTADPPQKLQLIGCCGLLIASKLKEEVIVDPECYVTASCNVFSKRQLVQKERGMYLMVDWKKVNRGFQSGIRQALSIFGVKDMLDRSIQLLWNCLKDEDISQWKDLKMIYGVISLVTLDSKQTVSPSDGLNLIRLI